MKKEKLLQGATVKKLVESFLNPEMEHLKEKAWRELSRRRLSNKKWIKIIKFAEVQRKKVIKQWKTGYPQRKENAEIIKNSEVLRERAWQKLLRQHPTNEELVEIMMIPSLKERAAEKLLNRGNVAELLLVMEEVKHLRQKVAKKLLRLFQKNPDARDNDALVWIIKKVKNDEIVDKAGRMLLRNNPTKKQVKFVLTAASVGIELATRAARKLLSMEPTEKELHLILDEVPDEKVCQAVFRALARLEKSRGN
jgi:hypothetical protein